MFGYGSNIPPTLDTPGSTFDTNNFHRLFKAKNTIHEMLTDRGYEIPPYWRQPTVEDEYSSYLAYLSEEGSAKSPAQYLTRMYFVIRMDATGSRTGYVGAEYVEACYVCYESVRLENKNSIDIGQVQSFESWATKEMEPTDAIPRLPRLPNGPPQTSISPTQAILITSHEMTAPARQHFNIFSRSAGMNQILQSVTHFLYEALQYNIIKHVENPQYFIIPREKIKAKLEELSVTGRQISTMGINDPPARYYGLAKGDLVKIFRDDSILPLISPHNIGYRIVV